MDKQLKNIIGQVINMKCGEVYERNFEDMDAKEKERFDNIKTLELEKELDKTLTDVQKKLFNKYIDENSELEAIIQSYMFKSGIKIGLRDLSFLKEELNFETDII